MSDIVKGDVVQLKSGGPKMTVENVGDFSAGMGMGPEQGALCVWFEKDKPLHKAFDVAVLQKV